MNASPPTPPGAASATPPPRGAPSDGLYVVHLWRTDASDPQRLRGRLEHVLSGRRHDFDSGAALLGCLLHEQAQLAHGAVESAAGAPPPCPDPGPHFSNTRSAR